MIQIALSSTNYPTWSVTVTLPANTTFQYKFIRKETDGSVSILNVTARHPHDHSLTSQVQWESDPNRQATLAASGTQTLASSWR